MDTSERENCDARPVHGLPGFMQGGGECGALIRSIDWADSSLGPPQSWPTALKTTLAIMLHSRHPMFLWWGPELIQFYNDAYVPSFGKGKHPRAMGQEGEDCWPEIWPIISPQIRDVMERGIPSWNENQLVPIYRDGGIQEVFWTYGYSPVFDEHQRVAGTLVICQETTSEVVERRAVEAARREADAARQRLANLFSSAPAFVCTLNGPKHVFELVNPLYQQLIGRDRRVLGKPLAEALPEVVGQGFIDVLDHVFESGESFKGNETRVTLDRGDGLEDRFATFVYQPRRDEHGQVQGIDVFGFDVTDAVAARVSAQRARDSSRALAESIPQQVWTAGPTGDLEFVNRRVTEYFGATEERVLGKAWLAFVHPDDVPHCTAQWSRSLSTGEDYEVEFRLRRHDGSHRWHLGRALALRAGDGKIEQWFGTNTDIDEHKRTRERLRAQAQFEQHLLGIVSHDLRTPLNVIALGAEVLAEQENTHPSSSRILLRIQSATRRAVRMINDLMDFTQARLGGGLPIQPRAADLSEIVDSVHQELLITHPSRTIQVVHHGNAAGSWDPDRIAQLLVNLITNAIQYGSPTDPIMVVVRGETEQVVVEVNNKGAPIPRDLLPKLFEPMQRGRKSSTERSIGLGLYIVQEIAKQHGGLVHVDSSEEVGTTFSVRLPRNSVAARSD
jgi:two-component system sensor histidine kinase VicK